MGTFYVCFLFSFLNHSVNRYISLAALSLADFKPTHFPLCPLASIAPLLLRFPCLPRSAACAPRFADFSSGSGTNPQRPARNYSNTVTPVTARQIASATVDPSVPTQVLLDGRPVHAVTLVGYVIEVTIESTQQTFMIDDSTGFCYGRQHFDSADGSDDPSVGTSASGARPDLNQRYVRVFGSLRVDSSSRAPALVVTRATEVAEFNEVTFHLLEALHTHLRNTQAPRGGAGAAGAAPFAASAGGLNLGAAPGMSGAALGGGAGAGAGGAAVSAPGGGRSLAGTTLGSVRPAALELAGGDLERAMAVEALMQLMPGNENGVSRAAAVERLRDAVGDEAARRAIDNVVEDGTVYTTFDDEHYLISDTK